MKTYNLIPKKSSKIMRPELAAKLVELLGEDDVVAPRPKIEIPLTSEHAKYLAQAKELYETIKTKIGKDPSNELYYESTARGPSGWIKESICMGILDWLFGDITEAKDLMERIDNGARENGFLCRNIKRGLTAASVSTKTADNALMCILKAPFYETPAREKFHELIKTVQRNGIGHFSKGYKEYNEYKIYSDECSYFTMGVEGTLSIGLGEYIFGKEDTVKELFAGIKTCFMGDDGLLEGYLKLRLGSPLFTNAMYGALACVLGYKDDALKMLENIDSKFAKKENLYVSSDSDKDSYLWTDNNSMMGIFLALMGGAKL